MGQLVTLHEWASGPNGFKYPLSNSALNKIPRFYVSTSKSIIKALINMHSFEIQLSPIG